MEKKLTADQIRELEQENIRREMARKSLDINLEKAEIKKCKNQKKRHG